MLLLGGTMLVVAVGCSSEEQADKQTPDEPTPTVQKEADESTQSDEVSRSTAEQPERPAMAKQVKRYIEKASRDFRMPSGKERYDHDYTAERLRKLAGALRKAASNWDLTPERPRRLEEITRTLREAADAIQRDRTAEHSPTVRDAFRAGSEALGFFAGEREGLDDLHSGIRSAADAIEPDVNYLDQTARAQEYFQRTARFLKRLYRK